jgi:hypothetical protein
MTGRRDHDNGKASGDTPTLLHDYLPLNFALKRSALARTWPAASRGSHENGLIARTTGLSSSSRGGTGRPFREDKMTIKASGVLAIAATFALTGVVAAQARAQDLGPQVRTLAEGVYVFVGENYTSNCGIVIMHDGVVLIDSGHDPIDSRKVVTQVR